MALKTSWTNEQLFMGPYGYRFQHRLTGDLSNEESCAGSVMWREYPPGDPFRQLPIQVKVSCDGQELAVEKRFPDVYRKEELLEASFTITQVVSHPLT